VGCADAVRAELLKLPGVLEVTYDAAADCFAVRYEAVVANLETMFGAIFQAGRMMGKEYFPEIVEEQPEV
jgi:copper chaperone CopZ